jgi:hypothetical protein
VDPSNIEDMMSWNTPTLVIFKLFLDWRDIIECLLKDSQR